MLNIIYYIFKYNEKVYNTWREIKINYNFFKNDLNIQKYL